MTDLVAFIGHLGGAREGRIFPKPCGKKIAHIALDGTPGRRYHVTRDCAQHGAGGTSIFSARTDDLIILMDYGHGLFQIAKVLSAHSSAAIAAGVAVPDRGGAKPTTPGNAEDESPKAQPE